MVSLICAALSPVAHGDVLAAAVHCLDLTSYVAVLLKCADANTRAAALTGGLPHVPGYYVHLPMPRRIRPKDQPTYVCTLTAV